MDKDTKVQQRVGRPSKSDLLNFDIAKNLAMKGFTIEEIAQTIEVSTVTIYSWMKKPKFLKAIKSGRDVADNRVELSLYKRAVGYSYEEVTYEKSKIGGLGIKASGGEIKEIMHTDCHKVKIVVKEVAPDTGAICFWLKNRKPEDWRDKREIEVIDHLHDKYKDLSDEEVRSKARELANELVGGSTQLNRN